MGIKSEFRSIIRTYWNIIRILEYNSNLLEYNPLFWNVIRNYWNTIRILEYNSKILEYNPNLLEYNPFFGT